jgi:3-hydroxyisobutyrate dehydrogenase-like beta-hydroxyacid dehydrogenase
MQKPVLGIIGSGFVGGAVARAFKLTNRVLIYDIDPKRCVNSFEEVCTESDFVFVCVPTPMPDAVKGGLADLSIVESVLTKATNGGFWKPIYVIKATIPVGTTSRLTKALGLRIIHSPEFLTARAADLDFITASRTVLGGERELVDQIAPLFEERFPGQRILKMRAEEAEAVKYVANCFFACKVMFFNEIKAGLVERYGLDWQTIQSAVLADGRIASSHTDVPGHDGKRGFGGTCFPGNFEARLESGERITLGELFERFHSGDDIQIESCDSQLERTEWKRVSKVTRRTTDEPLFRFTTSQGEIICTGEHWFPVFRDGRNVLVQAKEIKESDCFLSK